MARDHFSHICQNCGGELTVEKLCCRNCGVALEGKIELPRLARLNAEEREFIELFVLSAGSLKEVGKILHLSYPTVRARLDRVIASLQELDRDRRDARMQIIARVERGEISAEQAAEQLAFI
ncbi:DUF2089 domain-containing protein [uncultured Victivallis sp.]|uniref:DUF2089 domain-containing protein n=1 Tax=uncultured Victivallis sp. TaxID=354118 RepID=UPI0025E7A816|nr:DUF2089 domain-containing protein [uncultured Victivallis sp.]